MESYTKLLAYGECLWARARRGREGILTTKPYSRSERDKTGLMRQRVKLCPAKGFDNLHSLVRGSFAEALYHRQFTDAPAAVNAGARRGLPRG